MTSITGGSASAIGGPIPLGFTFSPVTLGPALPLVIAGRVISGGGSATVIGAKIIEGALNRNQLITILVVHELLDQLSTDTAELQKELKGIVEFVDLGMIPAFGRLLGSPRVVPLVLNRLSKNISSVIVGRTLGGFSVFMDSVIIAYAAYNLNKGNKTATSETIRKNAAVLKAMRVKVETELDGVRQ